LNGTEAKENWFSRGKAEADKGVPSNERAAGIAFVVVGIVMVLYFAAHQIESTGFFTTKFGTLEMLLLYGALIFWITTCALDGLFGQRLLSRLLDAFGGVIFITVSLAWLLVVFPFEFAYFADILPHFLRFLLQWISNDIARGIMVLGTIGFTIASVYSPIAYKFVSIKRSKTKHN
jgi:hypothetical protein